MIHFQISPVLEAESQALLLWRDLLVQAAQQALSIQPADSPTDASIVLTDDAQLRQLNRDFLGIDAPTDVLAFPVGEIDPDTGALYLGDIIISYARAASQAATGGHPVQAELQLLVVHGMLHLLGYDHADPPGKSAMWAEQATILRKLGCPIRLPAADE